jgi:hypothetical protein
MLNLIDMFSVEAVFLYLYDHCYLNALCNILNISTNHSFRN